MSDKEYIISSRRSFCEHYVWLIENGYKPHCLDETFVNGKICTFPLFHLNNEACNYFQLYFISAHYTPSSMITDTTVKSAKQVCYSDPNLSSLLE